MKVCGTCKQEGGWEYSGQYHDLHGVCEVCGKFTHGVAGLWQSQSAVGHTPGPWSCFQFSKHHNWKVDTGDEDWYVDAGLTAHSEAIAKFIVRACNSYDAMLEACRDAVAEYDIDGEVSTLSIMKLQKAIQQATQ